MFEQERWLPLRQVPEGSDAGGGAEPAAPAAEAPPPPSGPGSGRSELRQQLEKNFESDRKAMERVPSAPKRGKAPKRVAGGAEVEAPEAPQTATGEGEAPAEGEVAPPPPQPTVAAPEAFSAEAKAEWAKVPPAVQAAVAKRETDVARGVQQLQARYAEIDQALAPHMDAIRRYGQTPGKAVEQLFAWFNALGTNPAIAFPALARSFNLDLNQLVQAQAANQQGQQPAKEPTEYEKYIYELNNRINQLEQGFTQKLGTVETSMQRQAEEKTNEILNMWSKDKPHFQEVRHLMANLVASGSVPLKNGQVDLDRAYDMALYANPEVRKQVLAAQEADRQKAAAAKVAAEKKAQQEQAEKARRAGVSITSGAPGVPGAPGAKPQGKRKTVRESLMEAQAELADR